MPTISVLKSTRSQPFPMGRGSVVTGTGVSVEYTTDSVSAVANNTAVWSYLGVPCLINDPMYGRASAGAADGSVTIDDAPSEDTRKSYRADFAAWSKFSTPLSVGSESVSRDFGTGGAAFGAAFTFCNQFAALAPFVGVQLFFALYKNTPQDITLCKIAPSPTDKNDGTGLTWTTVTLPSATMTAGSAGTNPNITPSLIASDVIPISSIARTDDTTKKPLLTVRTYFNQAGDGINVADGVFSGWNASPFSNGQQYAHKVISGDHVTSIDAQALADTGTSWIQPAAIRFLYGVPSVTIAACGDSLTRGQGSPGNSQGFPYMASYLISTPAKIVQQLNFGISGQTHIVSMSTVPVVIAAYKPEFMTMFAWSPNDTATQTLMDASWARLMANIKLCRDNRVKPIIFTSAPCNLSNATQEGLRHAQNARVRGLSSVVDVVDVDALLRSAPGSSRLATIYDSGDGLHYSAAGYMAGGIELANVVSRYM